MNRLIETARIALAVAGVAGLLAGAAFATSKVADVFSSNARLREQVATLGREHRSASPGPTVTVSASPSVSGVSPSGSASPPPGSQPSRGAIPVTAPSGGGVAPPGGTSPTTPPRPPTPPTPSPTPGPPQPPPGSGCSPALVTATVPVGAFPCNTVTVARVARAGGTGRATS